MMSDLEPHLLVVDDDARLRALLRRYLSDNGFRVTLAADAAEARAGLMSFAFDLIVLDVMMPGETGIELTRSLRGEMGRGEMQPKRVPILLLTAMGEPEDRINGLEQGADDYLAKPFEPRELVLRIGNILKRTMPLPMMRSESIAFGPYVYHLERGELRQGDDVIHLTDREREMLRMLAATPGETVRRGELNGGGTVNERAVDVQINRLRRKIERDPANPLFLQAVRGVGYRLVAAP
jgi:two-component system, OmpR family, phosphate regulon response regulator OmpR